MTSSDKRSEEKSSLLGSSAVMAAGTIFSRFSGLIRGTLLTAALGTSLHADIFNIANTIPNMLYILLAGGVFNAVLVPQLVRAMKNDADGGEAYTNRIMTLAALFLGVMSILLVLAAPLLMDVILSAKYSAPDMVQQRESAVMFARYCLPQVFFYGMFVLVGQVLNSRGKFGPMMWAPIANNVISVATLITYLIVIGAADEREQRSGFSGGAEALLGLGSTLGIAVQLLVLIPYLKAAGFTFRPRFDFRGTGLGHTLKLGTWTVAFVIVNQIAYTVVVRLASAGTSGAAGDGGTGYTIYSNAFLLVMVPHSIITVSLATAMLPRLSRHGADGDLPALGRAVGETLRSTYALIAPVMALLPIVALQIASLLWGYGAARDSYADFAPTVSLFALGIFFFTTHYLMLRGFYALEQTRRVFWIQCVISVVNIVAAIVLTRGIDPSETAPRLVMAYIASYGVGSVLSYALLSRQVGGLDTALLMRFLVRMFLAVGVATAVGALVHWGVREIVPGDGKLDAVASLGLSGLVDLLVFVLLARALRITEVTDVTGLLTRRLSRRG